MKSDNSVKKVMEERLGRVKQYQELQDMLKKLTDKMIADETSAITELLEQGIAKTHPLRRAPRKKAQA